MGYSFENVSFNFLSMFTCFLLSLQLKYLHCFHDVFIFIFYYCCKVFHLTLCCGCCFQTLWWKMEIMSGKNFMFCIPVVAFRICTKLHKIDYFALKHFSIYYFVYAVFRLVSFFYFRFSKFLSMPFICVRWHVKFSERKKKSSIRKVKKEKLTNTEKLKKKLRIVLFRIRLYSFFKQKVKLYFALSEMMNFFSFLFVHSFVFLFEGVMRIMVGDENVSKLIR